MDLAKCQNITDFTKLLKQNEITGSPLQKLWAMAFGTGVALTIAGEFYIVDRKNFVSQGIDNASKMRDFVQSRVKKFQKAPAESLKIRECSPRDYAIHILNSNPDKIQGSIDNINALFDALKGDSFDDNVVHDMMQTAKARMKGTMVTLDADFIKMLKKRVENQPAPAKDSLPAGISPLSAVTTPEAQRFLDHKLEIEIVVNNKELSPDQHQQECAKFLKKFLPKNLRTWNTQNNLPARNEVYAAAFAIYKALPHESADQILFKRLVANSHKDLSGFAEPGKIVQ